MKVLIIGGVAGGASAAARLRRLDEKAEIVMLERGPHISFANCGLPYYVGGEIADRDALLLQTPESFRARFNVDVRVGHEALAIDRAAKTVRVKRLADGESYTEAYDYLLLAPGAEPIRPAAAAGASPRVFTLRTVPDADRLKAYIAERHPASAVVVGGGYIGLETVESLRRAGLSVTLVEKEKRLLTTLDPEMTSGLPAYLKKQGVLCVLGNGVRTVEADGDRVTVRLDSGYVEADLLVMAVGVRPETKLAKEAGLALGVRGAIVVDKHMRTSDPAVFAVGDAVQVANFGTGEAAHIPLAGPANRQGRIAAGVIAGRDDAYTATQGTAIVRIFGLTAACTGLNEAAAKAAGVTYDKIYLTAASHAGYYPGGEPMDIKVLFKPVSGRLLGAQIIGGDGVDKRCDVLATVIRLGGTAEDLTRLELSYAPPFGSAKDPVNMAGFAIQNVIEGVVKNAHWTEIDALDRRTVTLLDVRTEREFAGGHVDGFINIPLDSLRERVGELDPDKPVYVHCLSGLRSYLACRILSGHGRDCRNLSGGYKLYGKWQDVMK